MQKFKSPDLYFSRGEVYNYLEKYKEAVADYTTAHQIDPTLDARAVAENIKSFVLKTAGLINKKVISIKPQNDLKPAKIAEIAKSIPRSIITLDANEELKSSKLISFEELKAGKNTGVAINCKVLSYIEKAMTAPLSFLIMDSNGNFSCMSLYNTSKDVRDDVKPRSDCCIIEPFLSNHELMVEGKLLTYHCVKVTNLRNIYVNGKQLTSRFSKSEIVSKTMP